MSRRFLYLSDALLPWGERAVHGELGDEDLTDWLVSVTSIGIDLSRAFTLPEGAERLAILERLGAKLNEPHYMDVGETVRQRVEAITEALERTIETGRGKLLDQVEIAARLDPPLVDGGRTTEVTLFLKNDGTLLLSSFQVQIEPEQKEAYYNFLSKGEEVSLSFEVPPRPVGVYPLTVKWSAYRLDGKAVSSDIALAYEARSLRLTSKGDELESNPYSAGPPVDRPEMFFGRRTLLEKIRRQLNVEHRANVILLEGNRRTGKSSVLKYLERPGELPGWIPAYCQFQRGEGDEKPLGLPTREVFYLIARALASAIHENGYPIEIPDLGRIEEGRFFRFHLGKALNHYFANDRPFEALDVLIAGWLESIRPKRALLMLDEFDKLQEGIDNKLTSPQVPENLRYLFHTYPSLSGILTGSRRLKRLREEYWSALFGLGFRIGLDPLEIEEAQALVTEPVKGQLVYVPGARDQVVTLCACQPFLIQSLCNRIFEYCARSRE